MNISMGKMKQALTTGDEMELVMNSTIALVLHSNETCGYDKLHLLIFLFNYVGK